MSDQDIHKALLEVAQAADSLSRELRCGLDTSPLALGTRMQELHTTLDALHALICVHGEIRYKYSYESYANDPEQPLPPYCQCCGVPCMLGWTYCVPCGGSTK